MKEVLRIAVFIVAVLGSASCVVFVLATIENPFDDVTRAWTTFLAAASGVVALAAWSAFVWLRPRYEWVDEGDPE
jgi:hypothetical protein